MALACGTVSVTTTATAINAAGDAGTLVIANGATAIVVGASNVTATTGVPVAANGQLSLPIKQGQVVYAITASGSSTVTFLTT
jgi:hypothetical protein